MKGILTLSYSGTPYCPMKVVIYGSLCSDKDLDEEEMMRSRSDSTSETEKWSQVAGLLLRLGFYSKSVSMEPPVIFHKTSRIGIHREGERQRKKREKKKDKRHEVQIKN